MRVALLSFHNFQLVKGGTELFSEHLRIPFPDLTLITYGDSPHSSLPRLDRINLQEARMGMAIGRQFNRLTRKEGFDLVICNSTAGWWLSISPPPIPAMTVFHFTSIGLAEGTLKGTPGYLPSRYMLPWFETMASSLKHNIAVSPKVQRELAVHYSVRSEVIENGVDMERFAPSDRARARKELGIDHDGPLAIFVGRADHTKGFDLVRRIAALRTDLRVLCVTPVEVEGEGLIVRRNVPYDLMPLYYSAADLMLFPSRYESFGYAPLEAMACDIPVVASRTGIFEDLKDDRLGVVVPNHDLSAYLQAIDAVLESGRHPRSVVRERFSLERFTSQYREAAEEMVEKANRIGRKK